MCESGLDKLAGANHRGVSNRYPLQAVNEVRYIEFTVVAFPGSIGAYNRKIIIGLDYDIHGTKALSASEVLDQKIGGIVKIFALQGTGSLGLLGLALL